MEGMQKISETVLSKIRAEAQKIINQAEEQRKIEISRAEQQRATKHEEKKRKLAEEYQREATKIISEASLKSRQALLETKVNIINEISGGIRASLAAKPSSRTSLLNLIKESIDAIGVEKVRIYVASKDLETTKSILGDDPEIAAKVVEIKESECLGGAVIEDIEGKLRIVNTYETRMEMLLPRLLPEINKQLFEVKA